MVGLFRIDAMSVSLEFDQVGNDELIIAFGNLNKQFYKLSVIFDRRVIMKKKKFIVTDIILQIDKSLEIPKFIFENNSFVWLLDSESVEYGFKKLTECKKQLYFYPAEFGTIENVANIKHDGLDDMYFKFIKH